MGRIFNDQKNSKGRLSLVDTKRVNPYQINIETGGTTTQSEPLPKKQSTLGRITRAAIKSQIESSPFLPGNKFEEAKTRVLTAPFNTAIGKKVVGRIARMSEDLPAKAVLGVASTQPRVTEIKDDAPKTAASTPALANVEDVTVGELYEDFKKKKADPENTLAERFFYDAQNVVGQTALGVVLGFTPGGAYTSSAYWTAISADSQIQEDGEVTSYEKIAIDVVGDRILGNTLEKVFKGGTDNVLKQINQSGLVEAGTEPAQTLLKYASDYKNADSSEERKEILEEAKNYITSGEILYEGALGYVGGAGVSAGVAGASRSAGAGRLNIQAPQEEKFQREVLTRESFEEEFNNAETPKQQFEVLTKYSKDEDIAAIQETRGRLNNVARTEGQDVANLQAQTEIAQIKEFVQERGKFQEQARFQKEQTGDEFITTQQALEEFNKLPIAEQLRVEEVKQILTDDGGRAIGSYKDNLIKFIKDPKRNTLPHESVHAFLNNLTISEKENILTEVQDLFPTETLDEIQTEEKLAEIGSEYIVAHLDNNSAKKEEIINRFKTDDTGKSLIRRVLNKLARLYKKVTGQVDGVADFLESVVSQRGADIVANNKAQIDAVRKEMYQKGGDFTLKFFGHKDIKGRKTAPYEFIKNAIKNANPKKGERMILENTLELPQFKDNKDIDIREFMNETKQELLVLNPITLTGSDGYADYGLDQINRYESKEDAETIIINTDFKHGVKGHFSSAFDVTTTKEDLAIREIKAGTYDVQGQTQRVDKDQYAVLRADATTEDGVFGVFDTELEAEKYVENFTQRETEEAGMLSHYRAFADKDAYNIVEIQSDVFQKDLTPLLRSNEMLLASKTRQEREDIKTLEEARGVLESRNEAEIKQLIIDDMFSDKFDRLLSTTDSTFIQIFLGTQQNIYDSSDVKKATIEEAEVRQALGRVEIALNNIEAEIESVRREVGDQEGYFFRGELQKEIAILDNKKNRIAYDLEKINEKDPMISPVKYGLIIADNVQDLLDNEYFNKYNSKEIVKLKDRLEELSEVEVVVKMKEIAPKVIKLVDNAKRGLEKQAEILTDAQLKEIEKSKKFIDLRNIWHEITIKQAVRQAAMNGNDTVRFATDYTVANVESYVSRDLGMNEESYTVDEINDIGVGGEIEILSGIGKVVSINEDDYVVAITDGEITEGTAEEFYNLALETDPDLNKEDFDVEIYLNDYYGGWEQYKNNDGEDIYIASDSTIDTEVLAYNTSFEGTAEEFTLEDIPSEDHRTIAAKYGEGGLFHKYLKKIRPDLKLVTDENGFTWWESKIQPEDKGAVEMYQRAYDPERALKAIKNTGNKYQEAITELQVLTDNAGTTLRPADDPTHSGHMVRISTYPQWIPFELRNKKLMNRVIELIEEDKKPFTNSTRQKQLYDIFLNYLANRTNVNIYNLKPIRQMKTSAEIASLQATADSTVGVEEVIEPIKRKSQTKRELRQTKIKAQKGDAVEKDLVTEQQVPLEITPESKAQISEADLGSEDSLSLDKIITQTPVKNKINLIDLTRTPDRVLKKLGLEEEGQLFRVQYDKYLLELPQNLDIISGWVDRVPAAENVLLFKALDGKYDKRNLSEETQKVYDEIRAYFRMWADRLNLPQDKRITNYITHLFDWELKNKEFDEDLAKIIRDKIPGTTYDPFVLERLGAEGYVEDTWRALDAYTKRATRKVHMDVALEAIEESGSSLEDSQWQYVKSFVDRVQMRPTDVDQWIDNTVKASPIGYKLGQRPVTVAAKTMRRWTYRALLGANLGSALRNLSQGANTFAKIGFKRSTIGYAKLFNHENIEELHREGILLDTFIQDRTVSSWKKKMMRIDDGLFYFFNLAEKINRGSAYFGAKSKALSQGKSEEEAIAFGKEVVRKTQFKFDPVDTPLVLSSDLAKTLGQFLNFSVKQIEFLSEMLKNKEFAGLFRYSLTGYLYVAIIGRLFGMDWEELIPFFDNINGERKFSFAPSTNVITSLVRVPFIDDKGEAWEKVKKELVTIIPAAAQMKKTWQGYNAYREGGSFDKRGKIQFYVDTEPHNAVQLMLFGKYANENARDYFNRIEEREEEDKKVEPAFKEIKRLIQDENNKEAAKEIYDNLTTTEKEVFERLKKEDKAKTTLQGKRDITPVVFEVRDLVLAGDDATARELYEGLSKEQKEYFAAVKKDIENENRAAKGQKPQWSEGQVYTEKGMIGLVAAYAKALVVDPESAFKTLFSKERLNYIANDAVVMVRLPFEESQRIKKERDAGENLYLDHIIPLQLGGDNGEDNLKLVEKTVWQSYTPIENHLGRMLRNREITEKKAQDLIYKFKNGLITADEILEM